MTNLSQTVRDLLSERYMQLMLLDNAAKAQARKALREQGVVAPSGHLVNMAAVGTQSREDYLIRWREYETLTIIIGCNLSHDQRKAIQAKYLKP